MDHPYQIGKVYAIRCVTYHYIGELVAVTLRELVLKKASWLADSGGNEHRWHQFLADGVGTSTEIESYPPEDEVIVPRNNVVDAVQWHHKVPIQSQ